MNLKMLPVKTSVDTIKLDTLLQRSMLIYQMISDGRVYELQKLDLIKFHEAIADVTRDAGL